MRSFAKVRRWMAAALGTSGLALTLFGAAPAYANHAYVRGDVRVQHGPTTAATTYSPLASCSSTTCSVTVTLPKRDYNRVNRWCGAVTPVDVTIPTGQFEWSSPCFGPSDWGLVFEADLFDASQKFTTHTSDVKVTITLTT